VNSVEADDKPIYRYYPNADNPSKDPYVAVVDKEVNNHRVYMYTKEDDAAARYIRGRNIYRDVGTELAISLAMDRFQDCANNRSCESCLPPDPSPSLPTRVIDCEDPLNPRLFYTNGQHDQYVALSYVWGEPQPHRTTKQNIDSYMDHIDRAGLPQTLLDAIDTTHRLGVRYLWADSLCIIQDDDEDKINELSKMHSIYRHSYLTIVAASAQRVSEGFLQARPDTLCKDSFTLPFILPDGSGTGSVTFTLAADDQTYYAWWEEPTHTRAWCLQEYYLSSRVLVFASHTIQYVCWDTVQNIGGADNRFWVGRVPRPIHHFRDTDMSAEEFAKGVYRMWRRVVSDYTRRKLSVPADKLVAVAALAEDFSLVIQSDYLAGLWRCTLLKDLLWRRSYRFDPVSRTRPSAYRGPSWSWAAVDGNINLCDGEDVGDLVAEVIMCKTQLKTSELPFGEVVSGNLVLRAPIVPCFMRANRRVYRVMDADHMEKVREDAVNKGIEPKVDDDFIDEDTGRWMHEIGECLLDSSGDIEVEQGKQNIFVAIIAMDGDWILQGIVVKPVNSEAGGESGQSWYRVGFFEGGMRDADKWLEGIKKVHTMEINLV